MAKLGHIAATSGKLSGMGAGARGRLRAGTAAVALTGAALLLVSPGARAATQIGETFPTTLVMGTTVQFNLAATVEPDCDSDGLGDETQDSDLTSCDHSAPDTAITAGPNSRTKKKRAKFEFSGSDARAVAGFQCSVDGAEFNACASPFTVRVKTGRHTFSVSAVDANGHVDAAPRRR